MSIFLEELLDSVPDFYKTYLRKVEDSKVEIALENSLQAFEIWEASVSPSKYETSYANGKWTLKELIQHMIDSERVFSFRALWSARMDLSPLPGFDEKSWANSANPITRSWQDLTSEFVQTRISNISLFNSFNEEMLLAQCQANKVFVSTIMWGFIAAGHVYHPLEIAKERY